MNNTDNSIITGEDKRLVSLFQSIDRLSEVIENSIRVSKPELGGGHYLTDKEVSQVLKISRRCLQDYRTKGKIPFYRVGGKVLYHSGDIEQYLEEHYENRRTGKCFTDI